MRRYHLHNDTHVIEFPFTPAGLRDAKTWRLTHLRYKRRRIRDVLQLRPDLMPVNVETMRS